MLYRMISLDFIFAVLLYYYYTYLNTYLFSSVSDENLTSYKGFGLNESEGYRSGKKVTTLETFPSLREHILKYLQDHFVDKPGPR